MCARLRTDVPFGSPPSATVPPPQPRLCKEARPSFEPLQACQTVLPGTFILHRSIRYANVPKRTNETPSVTTVSKLLMRVIKAHARWRWRA
ncbi:Phosphoglycolate phosphatase [Pseudomonas syringae pv. actinidiae]|uniref:Phosphoglycolate phosphatase n=1 Tax=Pseudomonas syringae pv. actinidiae TaxID=103796 RepID=A0A2V0Q3X6_PSESF|nr:Phosphoglycolate phosphatase [Pseudomonas syringae pv. actinidiae]GBH14703.1 Phosphoglycolate phosphatase [Pseudomonas syringae pv. actinidiae]